MKQAAKITLGVALVLAGILWILCIIDIVSINIFFPGWWALFIIIPCVFGLFTDHDKIGSLFGIAIGILLMLSAQDILHWYDFWKFALACFLITVGLKFIFGKPVKVGSQGAPDAKKEVKNIVRDGKNIRLYEVSFGKEFLSFDNEIFEGVDVKAGFGAVRLDLRNAHIQPDAVIKLDCSFCGVEILVPDNIVVKVASDASFGGISDERKNKPVEGAATLYIDGNISFGGVEIK